MTIPNVSAGGIIDPTTFGNSVADQLNELPQAIQFGKVTVTGGASAVRSQAVTFPKAFAAEPTILTTVMGSGGGYYCNSGSDTATGFTAFVQRSDGANATADRVVAWAAIGELA